MTRGSWVAMSALCGLMATSAAQADLITIDADAYAPGTNVSNAFDGVTLSHLTFTSAGMQSNAVYAAGCPAGSPHCAGLGAASFGYQNRLGNISAFWYSNSPPIGSCLRQNYPYCYNERQDLLEVSFDQATDFIQFDSTHNNDWPHVWALDAAGNLLSVTTQSVFHSVWGQNGAQYGHQTMTITSALGNISRLVIAGNGGYSSVDSITYNGPSQSVPEPETLALLLAGLVGAVVTTRQRRKGAAV